MIDDIDFGLIHPDKRTKPCMNSYYDGKLNRIRCKSSPKNINFYCTEWDFVMGASDYFIYCEKCILERHPNIKQVTPIELVIWTTIDYS